MLLLGTTSSEILFMVQGFRRSHRSACLAPQSSSQISDRLISLQICRVVLRTAMAVCQEGNGRLKSVQQLRLDMQSGLCIMLE